MNQLSDMALVAQVVTLGNMRAFDRLVLKYQSSIRRFFLNMTCGDKALSDDLAQETFIKAYIHIGTFRSLSTFSTWLFSIAYHVFYDYLRSRNSVVDRALDDAKPEPHSTADNTNIDYQLDIYQAMQRLKDEERLCINMFYMEDMSIDRIAVISHMPVNTIKSHLRRAKQKMAEYLKQNGYEENR